MPQPEIAGLARVHSQRRRQITRQAVRIGTAIIVARAWPDSALERDMLRVVPAVNAAQRTLGALTDAYVIAQLRGLFGIGDGPGGVNVDDLLITEDTPWVGSAIKRWRRLLAEGMDPDEARKAAGFYQERLILDELRATELRAAERAIGNYAPRTGRKTLQYQRVPNATACGFCRLVADKLYSLDAALADMTSGEGWHTGCECGWAFVADPSAVANEIGRFRGMSEVDVKAMMAERATTPRSLASNDSTED